MGKETPPNLPEELPLTSSNVHMIKSWIDQCTSNESQQHGECSDKSCSPAPLRLIDVLQDDIVQLVEREGSLVQYAILSYCWGQSSDTLASRTVQSNVASRLKPFPLSSLPQTLVDSVIVARRLGIPYIWVDSICIVQESVEWTKEATRMRSYYENSYLTVVPVACSSADQGFLGPRGPWVRKTLPAAWTEHSHLEMHFCYPPWQDWGEERSGAAWASRAWTHQEFLLSVRTLFFGHTGLSFACRGMVSDEERPDRSFQPGLPRPLLRRPISDTGERTNLKSMPIVREFWYDTLSDYVERDLTYESDRLIALSGVAERVHEALGGNDRYISGFWESDICYGLCWQTVILSRRLRRNAVYRPVSSRFPSWSWCTMQRPLQWVGQFRTQCAQLVDLVKSSNDSKYAGIDQYEKLIFDAWIFPARVLDFKHPKGSTISVSMDSGIKGPGDTFTNNDHDSILLAANEHSSEDFESKASNWTTKPVDTMHDVIGIMIQATGNLHNGIREFRRLGVWLINILTYEDEHQAAWLALQPKYEQIYRNRCRIVLV
jgi:hypothetical protein